MKKSFRKIRYILLVLVLLMVNFAIPENQNVEAKTLRDLKEELAAAKEKYNNSQNEKKLTEQEIANKNAQISAISVEIDNIRQEIVDLTEEIEQLNIEIVEKEQEIKDIMNYYQLSNGESAYLEYVFEAADFTDFIYRMAIAEQLSNYNDKLVDEYNETIKQNEQKKKDLAAKTVSLNEKQKQLEADLVSLGSQLSEITDISISAEEEIEALEELVNTYEKVYKCDLDEDINSCGGNQLPPGTQFLRPVVSGYLSSNYGKRTYFSHGKKYSDFHHGVDFAGTGHGAPVYSAANGKVAYIIWKASCGGNMLFIHHTVNGVKYTTGYFHLATVNVSIGDTVTTNTVIGTVGGDTSIETWEEPRCTSGPHLHFQISEGHIPAQQYYYTAFTSKSFNPRNVLNIPAEGGWFSNKLTKY